MCNYKASLGVPFLLKGHIFISNLAIYNSDFLPILLYQFGSFHRSQTVRSRTWQHFPGMTRPCCGTHSISSCLSCFKIAPLPPISLPPLTSERNLTSERKRKQESKQESEKRKNYAEGRTVAAAFIQKKHTTKGNFVLQTKAKFGMSSGFDTTNHEGNGLSKTIFTFFLVSVLV